MEETPGKKKRKQKDKVTIFKSFTKIIRNNDNSNNDKKSI